MTQKFYVNPDGSYCGSLIDIDSEDAADEKYRYATEVASPPPSGDARQIWDGDSWLPLPDPVPIIDAIDLWSRATDGEAEAIETYMAQAPARARNIFRTAITFRGDHELFGMLETAANALFSPERVAVLLAPSRYE